MLISYTSITLLIVLIGSIITLNSFHLTKPLKVSGIKKLKTKNSLKTNSKFTPTMVIY